MRPGGNRHGPRGNAHRHRGRVRVWGKREIVLYTMVLIADAMEGLQKKSETYNREVAWKKDQQLLSKSFVAVVIVIVLHRGVKAFEVQQVGDSPINPPAVLHPLCFRCFTSIPG